MSRVKRGTTTHARHRKVLRAASGYRGRRSRNFRTAVQAVERARQYAYRDRRARKRNFRALWIQRINAGARQHGLTYSQFMNGLHRAGIEVDRKNLSQMAFEDPAGFAAVIEAARSALGDKDKDDGDAVVGQ
ncbi:MAG: 50S ribosomal protein L20 [Alphaproteobacteria bacterium]|nr:50S ribosomal protein L20 [Alphaproteobacteria bacterium]MDA7983047.1 50S ribosomal protein L20 [Alphaproteobacteria bacterium]MDA7984450.1 50S ribosomal protein L20 [Alphaproteobacteria bacterium]MDA7987277.1 50S ribosomal protein L20 [Alphaproteobacteria bacterium]MDA7988615.1 50S ribosomal protein L20 [Alphaproteobacteria bacterium]